jgi:hypothetical protein
MRWLTLLIVPLLTGCIGSVTLTDTPVDSFSVGSATWFEVKVADATRHTLAVSNQSGICEAMQGFLPSATERVGAWFDAGADCSEGEDLFTTLASESAEIYAADDNWMRIGLTEGTADFTAPATGDYESAGDPGWTLDLGWYRENPWKDAADNIDDSCIFGVAAGILFELDPFTTHLDEEVGGDLELIVDGDNVKAVGMVDLLDDDNEDAGRVEFEFDATRCKVDIGDHSVELSP